MIQINDKWDVIKDTVRTEYGLSDISYNTWIKKLELFSVDNEMITILIPSDQSHALKYINDKYKSYFQVTITEMFDYNYEIKFVLEKDINNLKLAHNQIEQSNKKNPEFYINYEKANLNQKYKFDTFVVGSNNKFAHSACLAVAESPPGEAYNPLFLYGGPGLGKTHLMHSIGHFVLEQDPNKKVLYVTSEAFTNEVIESIRSGNNNSMTKLREKYRTVDVLMVDDVQFIIGKESTQEEFFHTFNVLHSSGKQIILSSDKPPKEMETLEERFRSRFEWGLSSDIQAPDYETRVAILMKNAENCNKYIDEEIIKYIATNIKSNIRELEGAFNKVIAASRLSNTELNIALAEYALKDIINPNTSQEITPTYIIEVVSEHFNISPDDLTSKKRNAEYVLPRQIFMYICRELIDIPLTQVARILGKKDHTTILHGIRKVDEEMEKNQELRNKVEIIKNKITSS